ncbi:MAG: ABC transporter [Micrococcales bacterium 73-15]|uniref:ABC transporter ATP-binding protein n=1 Tax=Salana multivorans TaxID=120377 RepID=UPI0009665235|nr:ABC transporter ATP-binding protein [Salana multivorans]OJX95711.1 MAG: ABC transporter [Micrococcales bacterium 73-15]
MPVSPGPKRPAAPRSTPATMLRLLDWVRPVLPRIVMGGITALLASLMALAIPQVLRVVIEGPLLSSGSVTGLVWATALVLALGLIEAFLVWCRRVFIATAATGAEHDMRVELYHRLLDLPIAFHNRTSGGQLIQRSMGDLSAVRRWVAFGFVMMVVSSATIVVGVVLMIVNAWQLGLLYLVGAIVMVVLTFRLRRSYGAAARRARDQAGDLATNVEESVQGIRVLKAFGRGEDAHEDFFSQADELRRTELVKAGAQARITAVLTILPESLLAVSLGLGAYLVVHDQLTIGALSAFFVTAAVVNRPVEMLGNLLAMTLDARAALDRYLDVIDLPNPLTDPADPARLPAPATPEGSTVELRDVVVQFSPDEAPVLDGVDLVLPPGRTTALVGLTGSGKSTLLALLPRLLDTTSGSVLLDGVDVRDLSRRDVRSIVAPAFEDSVLFSTSVRDNVLMGAAATARAEGTDADGPAVLTQQEEDTRLAEALEAAQADFVADLEDGTDTIIGEEGLSLSGGQRQRLSLARAIAARPRVLVLDDPLSAVDVATETAATDALRRLLPGTTTLVVAHRPSTVALADHVVVLEGGRITGAGTHTELLAGHPHYRYVLTAMEQEHPAEEDVADAEQAVDEVEHEIIDEAEQEAELDARLQDEEVAR